jgi:hypothetical protein
MNDGFENVELPNEPNVELPNEPKGECRLKIPNEPNGPTFSTEVLHRGCHRAGGGSRLLVGDAKPECEHGKQPPTQYFGRRRRSFLLLNVKRYPFDEWSSAYILIGRSAQPSQQMRPHGALLKKCHRPDRKKL